MPVRRNPKEGLTVGTAIAVEDAGRHQVCHEVVACTPSAKHGFALAEFNIRCCRVLSQPGDTDYAPAQPLGGYGDAGLRGAVFGSAEEQQDARRTIPAGYACQGREGVRDPGME